MPHLRPDSSCPQPPKSIEQMIVEHGSKAWTVKKFADLFSLSTSAVYNMINEGWLPGMGKGNAVRIDPTAVWNYHQTMVEVRQSVSSRNRRRMTR